MADVIRVKNIFCTKCATVTAHTGYVDHNNEYIFECPVVELNDKGEPLLDNNGNEIRHSFVKFPAVKDSDELNKLIDTHEEINKPIAEGLETTREQQKILEEVLEDGTEVEVSASESDKPAE